MPELGQPALAETVSAPRENGVQDGGAFYLVLTTLAKSR